MQLSSLDRKEMCRRRKNGEKATRRCDIGRCPALVVWRDWGLDAVLAEKRKCRRNNGGEVPRLYDATSQGALAWLLFSLGWKRKWRERGVKDGKMAKNCLKAMWRDIARCPALVSWRNWGLVLAEKLCSEKVGCGDVSALRPRMKWFRFSRSWTWPLLLGCWHLELIKPQRNVESYNSPECV